MRDDTLTSRPLLNSIPLSDALPLRPGTVNTTMSPGQWDAFLAVVYDEGGTLLELDDDEQPVAAYRRPQS